MSWTDYDTDPFEGLPKVAHPDLTNPNRELHFVPVGRSLDTEALLSRRDDAGESSAQLWVRRALLLVIVACALAGGLAWLVWIDKATAVNVRRNLWAIPAGTERPQR